MTRKLLLVTGAGASRELGLNGEPMPLMGDWAKQLLKELSTGEGYGLAEVVGLSLKNLEEFETRIGTFLHQAAAFRQFRPMAHLGNETLGQGASEVDDDTIFKYLSRVSSRSTTLVEALHKTLFDLFGAKQINWALARDAYQQVLSNLGADRDTAVAVATTNYDVAAEFGLHECGRRPYWGEDTPPRNGAECVLQVEGIAEGWSPRRAPILHLHGRVGWYRIGDRVLCRDPHNAYNPGSDEQPALLLPDPAKDYSGDLTFEAMWKEFDSLLSEASGVFVIGHSLHDPLLVERLRTVPRERVAVSSPIGAAEEQVDWMRSQLPDVAHVALTFGPNMAVAGTPAMETWLSEFRRSG